MLFLATTGVHASTVSKGLQNVRGVIAGVYESHVTAVKPYVQVLCLNCFVLLFKSLPRAESL
jgi:hypothetical protein